MNKEKQKIVPALRFLEFEKNKWVKTNLGSIGKPLMCKRIFKEQTTTDPNNTIPFFKIGTFGKEADAYIPIKLFKEYKEKYSFPNIGEILISASGTIGRLVVYDGADAYFQDSNIVWIENDETQIINSLLFYCYSTLIWQTSDGGVIKRLYNSNLKEMVIHFPENQEEQRKIANGLSSLDNIIKAETEKLCYLKDHKKGLLQQLFPANGETRPQYRFSEFKNDGDWEITTLGKIAKFRRGSFPQPYGRPEWYDDENGMPFIQVYDVDTNLKIKPKTKRRISALAAEKSVFIAKGTVIITIQGSIGRVAITQYDAYIDRTLLLFEEFYKPIDKLFFAYVIQLLFEIEKEKAPGGIIKTITKEVLTSFNIYVPDVLEQQKIAKCLSSLDDLITAQTQKTKALKKHKKGLMQKLFPNINDLT